MRKGRFSNSKTEWDRGVWVPGAFKLDHLHPFEPISFWQFSICFIFILGGHFLLPQRTNSEKREKSNSRNECDRGVQCLEHSNRTICSTLSPICSGKFQFVLCLYWEANSYYPRGLIVREGRFSNSKTEWDRGFWVPGVFKRDHLHPYKPLLFWKFSISFTFILGSQFLLPKRAINGKGEIFQFKKWLKQRVLGAWGIQTGPFASL